MTWILLDAQTCSPQQFPKQCPQKDLDTPLLACRYSSFISNVPSSHFCPIIALTVRSPKIYMADAINGTSRLNIRVLVDWTYQCKLPGGFPEFGPPLPGGSTLTLYPSLSDSVPKANVYFFLFFFSSSFSSFPSLPSSFSARASQYLSTNASSTHFICVPL